MAIFIEPEITSTFMLDGGGGLDVSEHARAILNKIMVTTKEKLILAHSKDLLIFSKEQTTHLQIQRTTMLAYNVSPLAVSLFLIGLTQIAEKVMSPHILLEIEPDRITLHIGPHRLRVKGQLIRLVAELMGDKSDISFLNGHMLRNGMVSSVEVGMSFYQDNIIERCIYAIDPNGIMRRALDPPPPLMPIPPKKN